MPASETFWRNLKTMHIVFAVSTFALLAVTFWMMADDYSSEWRGHQQMADRLNALKLRHELGQVTSDEYQQNLQALQEQIKQAKEGVAARRKEIEDQKTVVAGFELAAKNSAGAVRTQRAVRDKARADYDLAVRDELAADVLDERFDEFEAEQAAVERMEKDVEQRQRELAAEQAKLDGMTKRLDDLEADRKKLQADVKQLEDALNLLEPDSSLAAAKRWALDLPILDGFSQVHKIQLDWLPDLDIQLGMAKTARFDRCRTCHISIDRIEAGNVPMFPHGKVDSDKPEDWVEANKYPHPYATHPRPDLYLTAASPHPVQKFGCTICHEGQGSATNFNNAQHGPSDPHQEDQWAEKYHHHYNHFWEYPMLPERFEESSCLKCHHDVVELGVNPKFGPTAPKLYEGFQLIQKFGCFGCHEMHGYTGTEAIGPDLRLEPNYNAAALELLNKLPRGKEDGKAVAEVRRLAKEVADAPADTGVMRNQLRGLIAADAATPSPLLPVAVHRMADSFKNADMPGLYRKVGPALRYVAKKTTPAWVEYWTEDPQRFRPTTRMPRFFGNTNQQDAHAANLMPLELAAISEYLFDKSQPFELLSPEPIEVDGESKPYEPDAVRGKNLFATQGCLACHTHKEFPKVSADFGPELSKVHEKIRPGADGFKWLYTWLRDPKRYHPRTKMPNLFLTQRKVGDAIVDPAADIAAYLLKDGPAEFKQYSPQPYLGLDVEQVDGTEGLVIRRVMPLSPASRVTNTVVRDEKKVEVSATIRPGAILRKYAGKPVNTTEELTALVAESAVDKSVAIEVFHDGTTSSLNTVIGTPLDDMVRLFLTKAIGIQKTEDFLKTGDYPVKPEKIKGDEIELVRPADKKLTPEQWRQLKMNYVGRRTISRYGCYGCHDIPGFEEARPIGATLQDWGRKDTSKLALEHIEEYLHHHGEADGSSTNERVEQALKNARAGGVEAGEFASAEVEEREMATAGLYGNLLHHRREGFLWQKLRQPRSYDYRKVETKGYDERLRMPKFPLTEKEIEAISTFVLGLVASPPAEQYVYQPQGAAKARIAGEFLLNKYNCASCHMLELPQVAFALEQGEEGHPYRSLVGWTAEEIAGWFVKNRKQLLAGDVNEDEIPDDVKLMQRLGAPLDEIVQLTNDDKVSDTDRAGMKRLTESVHVWLNEHPQYLLTDDLKLAAGEFPEGVDNLLRLKPPVDGVTGQKRESGEPIVRFHGLLNRFIDEEEPEDQVYAYQLWDTLEVGGRIMLPSRNMSFSGEQIDRDSMKPARGGDYAQWLVERLVSDRDSKASGDRGWGWTMSPPPLYLEGLKVQTPWLYQFLKNPHVIRHEAVLRMPRFNLDDAEAKALASYFAAVDDSEFPYQDIPQRQPGYLAHKNEVLEDVIPDDSNYLAESWKLLNANVCIGCHSVGGKTYIAGPDAKKVLQGPDLNRAYSRLRPDWLGVWLARPQWIMPYTKMAIPKPEPSLLNGQPAASTDAWRDALLNYPLLLERDGAIFYDPKTKEVKPASEAVAAPTD